MRPATVSVDLNSGMPEVQPMRQAPRIEIRHVGAKCLRDIPQEAVMSVGPERSFKGEYSPEELSTLAVAYETICDAARVRDASPIVRDLVARSVFQVASTGEHDPLRIVDCVMYKLGLSMRFNA